MSVYDLFPLTFTEMEHLMYWDATRYGTSADAMTRFSFSGRINRKILEAALEHVYARHPLTCATATQNKRAQMQWHFTEDHLNHTRRPLNEDILVWRECLEGEEHFPDRVINLENAPGMKFWVYDYPSSDRTIMYQHFHHATTDALGAFQFMEEVMLVYHLLWETYGAFIDPKSSSEFTAEYISCLVEKAGILDPVFPKKLLQRGAFSRTVSCILRGTQHNMALWLRCLQNLTFLPFMLYTREKKKRNINQQEPPLFISENHGPVTVRPPMMLFPEPCNGRNDYLRTVSIHLSPEETSDVRMYAKLHGVTVNDVLLSVLIRGLDQWYISQKNTCCSRGPYLIAIPASMRNESHLGTPIANIVSVLFLHMNAWETRVPLNTFLKKIRKITQFIKIHHLAEYLLWELKLLTDFSWFGKRLGMRWFGRSGVLRVTTVISNLGVLFTNPKLRHNQQGEVLCGNLTLQELNLASPLNVSSTFTVPVGTYAGRLMISVVYDPRYNNADILSSILDRIYSEFKSINVGET